MFDYKIIHNGRNIMINYIVDVWGEYADDYDDYSNQELLRLIKDMGRYKEFVGYAS